MAADITDGTTGSSRGPSSQPTVAQVPRLSVPLAANLEKKKVPEFAERLTNEL